jgi:hypothetical protein
MVPAPLQRPTLNVLTATEGRALTRPSEKRTSQSTDLLPGFFETVPQRVVCFDEPAADEPQRSSIFDAQSSWVSAPAKESTATKENTGPRTKMVEQVMGNRGRRNVDKHRSHGRNEGSEIAIFVDEELRPPLTTDGLSPPTRRPRIRSASSQPQEVGISAAHQRLTLPPSRYSATPLPSGRSGLPSARRAPGAPSRDLRRRRPETPQDTADDLIAGLSSLRLGGPPPAKRIRTQKQHVSVSCQPMSPAYTFASIGLPRNEVQQTPPSYCEENVTELVACRSQVVAMDTAELVCTPPRPHPSSLKTALFGESSGSQAQRVGSSPRPLSPRPRRQIPDIVGQFANQNQIVAGTHGTSRRLGAGRAASRLLVFED